MPFAKDQGAVHLRRRWFGSCSSFGRVREAGQGAFPDQLPLELGQRREDAEHEAAGRGRGVDLRTLAGEHPQAHPAGRQVLHGVDQVSPVSRDSRAAASGSFLDWKGLPGNRLLRLRLPPDQPGSLPRLYGADSRRRRIRARRPAGPAACGRSRRRPLRARPSHRRRGELFTALEGHHVEMRSVCSETRGGCGGHGAHRGRRVRGARSGVVLLRRLRRPRHQEPVAKPHRLPP